MFKFRTLFFPLLPPYQSKQKRSTAAPPPPCMKKRKIAQQFEDIKIKTYEQGFCFKVFRLFCIKYKN